jgi:3-oxosteroid 1-dehydrogenase
MDDGSSQLLPACYNERQRDDTAATGAFRRFHIIIRGMSGARHCDFVVVGGGLGGLAAAIRAHDLGLATLVLEKSDQLGGTGAQSSGYQWCAGSHLAAREGIADTWQAGFAYLRAFAGGTHDDRLLETLCRTAPDAFAYFESVGVRWRLFSDPDNRWPDLPSSVRRGRSIELEPFDPEHLPHEWRDRVRHSPRTHLYTNEDINWKMGGRAHRYKWHPEPAAHDAVPGLRQQGSALGAYLVVAAHARGIPVLTDAEVEEVLTDGVRATGVAARIDGERQEVRAAKGVLVATGGYDWNRGLVERFDKRTSLGSSAPATVTGDHFELLRHFRPVTRVFPRHSLPCFVEPAGFGGDPQPRQQVFWGSFPHALVVNASGRRFGSEDDVAGFGNRSIGGRMFDAQGLPLNWPAFGVFDSQYRAKYAVGRAAPWEPIADCIVSAPTLEELGGRLGIDGKTLHDTVERFNAGAREGRDPEFGRGENLWSSIQYGDMYAEPNHCLGPLDEPPFYGVRLTQTTGGSLTAAGLLCDEHARIVNADGEAIERLYATGNAMAYRDLGGYFHSGTANTRNITWAYVAATHAADTAVQHGARA